ncbi:MFS transporter [Microlunatus ginsengisoli]|uniref:MFS transporter n=1 Tax=Microlunatus ginsengisoli TaxID=363863 RepID=A0ABP6ZFK4_9ACTN
MPGALWRMAFAAGLASYLDAATIISISVSLAIWRSHYGLEVWQVGLLTAGLAFAIALGAVLGGWLGDRIGRNRVFSYDLGVFVVGTVLILAATDAPMLIGGVIVVGLAAGADVPTSLAVIADAAPDSARGRLIGLTQTMWIAGILATFALGFAVSTLDFRGTQIMVAHLVVLATITLGLRLLLSARDRSSSATTVVAVPPSPDRRALLKGDVALPLLATGGFFVFWNIASTTLGNFGTYFLITQTRLSQSQATGLVLIAFPPALVMSLVFVRLADTVWRDRLFVVAMVLQIAAFGVGAVTAGAVAAGMVALVGLYSLSNVFAGEAIYKVWSQLLIPAPVRASALGLTYGTARAVAAAFMFAVPALIDANGGLLMGILTVCVIVSGAVGLVITRHPRLSGPLRARRA